MSYKKLFSIALLGMGAWAANAAEVTFDNGSFERGTSGFWVNRQAAVRVDTTDSSDGMQCVAVEPVAGGTVNIVQGVKFQPGQVYVITFDARSNVATDVPQLTMQGMLQGANGPLAFFEGVGEQRGNLKTPAAVTDKWQTFTQKIGPLPAEFQGKEVTKLMLYWNVKPGAEGAKLYLDNIRVTTEDAPEQPAQAAAPESAKKAAGLLNNGSFERGTAGFWINRQAAVKAEAREDGNGKCLKINAPENSSVDIVQGTARQDGKIYVITFDARVAQTVENGPQLTLKVMLQGDRPIGFFPGVGEQKNELKTPCELSGEWQTFTRKLGPVPAEYMGKSVKNVLFYWNVKQGAAPAQVELDNLVVTVEDAPAAEEAEASSPAGAFRFHLPDPVQIFESVPEFTVEAAVGAGEVLRVIGSDAFNRETFRVEGERGAQKVAVTLPGPDYYRVRAEIDAGGKVVKSAETSLLVTTPLPGDYRSTPHPAFGVWGGLTPELRRVAGAKWDRQLFFTFFQKPDAPAEAPDAETVAAREPINIIRCMNIMHPFKKMVPYSAEELEEQREKLTKEIISRRGLVDVWETQNEPMVGENFHGTMDDVMNIIRMESEVVRANDPGRPIAGICINPMNANQYNQYIGYYRNHGIASHIDALMLHPYIPGAQSPDGSGYVEVLNKLAREVEGIAGRKVPMYISEIGYSTKPGGEVTELQQAAYLARVVLLNRKIPQLVACIWHIGLWNEATSRRELDFGLLRGHPKGSALREPKPAFAAWATVSRQTYDAEYIRELELSRQVRVLLFEKRGEPLLAVYSLTPEPARVQLPLNVPEVTVTEVCGKSRRVALEDGILSLEVTEAPVYIQGGSKALFEAGKFAAKFEPETLESAAGVPLTVSVTLPEELARGAELRVPAGAYGTAEISGSGASRQVVITPKQELQPGFYDLFFRLEADGVSRYIWQKSLEILPPLELEEIHSTTVNDGPALEFDVLRHGDINEAVIEILENKERVIGLGQVTPGKRRTLPLFLTRYGRPNSYQARFTAANGRVWSQALPDGIVNLTIPFFDDALDQPDSEWPNAGVYKIDDGVPSRHAVRGEFDRPSGVLRLAYDERYLYFSIDQADKTFVTREAGSLWDGDSLQIGVSVPQKFMIRPNNDGIQETAYAEFGVKADNAAPDSWVWASMNLNNMPLNGPIPGFIGKNRRDGELTCYRFAIPWETLNIRPDAGMPLKISILFNDRDAGRDRHWLEWYSGIADGKDPSRYGSAVLGEH